MKKLVCMLVALLVVLAAWFPAFAESGSDLQMLVISQLIETIEDNSSDFATATAVYDEDMDAIIVKMTFAEITSAIWDALKADAEALASIQSSNNSLNEAIIDSLNLVGADDIEVYILAFTVDGYPMAFNVNGNDLTEYL